MKLRYVNAVEDVIALARHHSRHSTTHRLLVALARWVMPGLLILVSLPYLGVNWTAFLYGLIPAVVIMLTFGWVYDALYGLMIRARHREGKNKGVLGPHELELAPPDLIERTPVSETRHWLGALERVVTTPTHAFIYLNSFSAHVIPRAGVTDGDFEAFVEAVRQEAENAEWVRSRRPGGEADPGAAPRLPGGDHVSPKQD
jgi:hypothetical protein